jgi:very-short-patch-repair endonuclease
MKKHPAKGAHHRARRLRQDMTDAERKLWSILRMDQMQALRFRRQVPIGPYVADFVCHEARLIIEVDGGQHDLSSDMELKRTRFLEGEGYRLIRFWNNEVLANLDGVYTTIIGALDRHHPHPTLPHRGGGLSPEAAS